ncbi:probable thiamin biosynthesis protein thi-4 [Cephalotrichum gorgonifer]|uniref:Probable thiamin biosynthesis protein thi-4 n=1 Tax=Cephalotrichum gorgonifer TaxID=2041049 RepID=A0AAE8N0Q9_9PEZI|nr:probable thiamin biosynthesis protein thi-4 [Cephalotrichum gorgonifer]
MSGRGRVLVIAGSDCSGGAGLEADQKTIAAHGCYAMAVTTAVTAQDTTAVYDIHHIPPQFVARQIEICMDDIGQDAVKIGMLGSGETAAAVAKTLVAKGAINVVVDPVMVSTSGGELLPGGAVNALCSLLLPHATVLTPNIPEAHLLDKLAEGSDPLHEIKNVTDLEKMAARIQSLGPKWVLLKGGHMPLTDDLTVAEAGKPGREPTTVVDILYGEGRFIRIQSPYQVSRNTHGTGCTLASAIASNLSRGMDVPSAVHAGCRYIQPAISTAPGFGKGHGPLNHFHSSFRLPFSRGYFIEYLLSRPDVKPVWHEFVHHPFVMAMGNGKLPLESFKGYIIQDYLYLIHFARAHALAAYKATNSGNIIRSNEIVTHIFREIKLHIEYCKSFGISIDEIESTPEMQACTAYTRFLLDIGHSQDLLALQVALAPCTLGYGDVAKMLFHHPDTKRSDEGNTYWAWIENYVADDYTEAVRLASEQLETEVGRQTPERIEELVKIFIHGTKLEIGFWEMFPSE